MNSWRRFAVVILAASTVTLPSLRAVAQQLPMQRPQSPNSRAPLDSLDENRLMDELASRGMTKLLDHYFEQHNVPPERRKEILVVIALRNLDSESFARKSSAERKQAIQEIVNGINEVLPTINDPQRLMRYATALILNGTERLVSLLEIWDENPRTQAALRPIAETVDKILARAQQEADARAAAILSQIKKAEDPRVQDWEAASHLANVARWNRGNADYGLALSYDRADPERAKVCKQAIDQLKAFDEEDSDVHVQAELIIGKLNLALGGKDGLAQAHEYFDKVIKVQSEDEKDPKKYVLQQYQGRYFSVVADVQGKKLDGIDQKVSELKAWEDANMPGDQQTRLSVESSMSMLEYRVASAVADAAKDPAERQRLNQAAVGVLLELVTRRPDLRGIVFEQVIGKLPEHPDLKRLDPLMLEALVNRGIVLSRRPAGSTDKGDSDNIQLAADAAREIVRRKGQPGISPEQLDNSAFSIGVFEERIGSAAASDLTPAQRDVNKQDAAEAFLNYVQQYAGNPSWSENALEHALTLLADLRKANANDDRTNKLYDHALDVGLHKAGRQELAFPYAMRRKDVRDYSAAARGFALVKSDKPLVNVMARYWQMFCDDQMLRDADAGKTKALSTEIQKLSDELSPMLDSALAAAPDAKAKASLQLVRVRTILIAAEVARTNKDAARTVQLLNGFENQLAGLNPAEQEEMTGNALFLRINALIALNHNEEAIAAVENLVKQNPTKALSTISTLLTKLNENYNAERGRERPDTALLTTLASQRAQLSALLVKQVKKDPTLPAQNRRQYLTFNAHSQVEASKLQTDPAKRSAYLSEALKTYEELLKGVPDNDPEHANLQRLIALANFEIGDADHLQKAHDTLNTLFAEKKFGTAMIRVGDEAKSNELFWEGLLRLLQSKAKLAALKNDPAMKADASRILKEFIIQFGDQTGGEAYAKDFRILRKELLGDWKPTEAPATTPAAK